MGVVNKSAAETNSTNLSEISKNNSKGDKSETSATASGPDAEHDNGENDDSDDDEENENVEDDNEETLKCNNPLDEFGLVWGEQEILELLEDGTYIRDRLNELDQMMSDQEAGIGPNSYAPGAAGQGADGVKKTLGSLAGLPKPFTILEINQHLERLRKPAQRGGREDHHRAAREALREIAEKSVSLDGGGRRRRVGTVSVGRLVQVEHIMKRDKRLKFRTIDLEDHVLTKMVKREIASNYRNLIADDYDLPADIQIELTERMQVLLAESSTDLLFRTMEGT